MTQDVQITLGSEIVYVTGTVNSVSVIFTLVAATLWRATVERDELGIYELDLLLIDAASNQTTYRTTLYYAMPLMIYDRTPADLTRLLYLRRKIDASGWDSLTAAEQNEWLSGSKAAYNYTDLNRVEQAVHYLSDRLQLDGYYSGNITKEDWCREDIPRHSDMLRYLGNVKRLVEVYCLLPTSPGLPATMDQLDISGANAIEKVLVDINYLIGQMEAAYHYCSETNCGEGGYNTNEG